MPRFSISLKRFICFPVLPGQLIFSRQLCGPLLPPAQECNSLQCISFTHHHAQYLPPFLRIYPQVYLPVLKILYPGAHISN